MYIREVKTKNKETATEYSTYRLVKNIRIGGVPKQINLISMGKLENIAKQDFPLLAKRIDELYNHQNILFPVSSDPKIEEMAHFFCQKLIQKNFVEREELPSDIQEFPQDKEFVEIDINSITGKTSEQIGGEFLCSQAINELELETFLQNNLNFNDNQVKTGCIALIGRLLHSSNENQTVRWLNDNSAYDEFYPLDSGKVNKNQLYSAANQLYKYKNDIEKHLNQKIEKIFNFKRKIVLYDLTNTHFEGQMEGSEKSTFGSECSSQLSSQRLND